MDVSIILVNYNTKELTSQTIESIIKYSQNFSYEIILIDNNSLDGSKQLFENDSRIRFISSETNLGFGRANNLAATFAKGEFLFLLNTDTILLNNAIYYFLEFYKTNSKNKNIGVLGCVLYDSYNNEILSHIPFKSIPQYLKLFNQLFSQKIFKTKPKPITQNLDLSEFNVEAVLGADMFLRRDLFEEVGGFDKSFFLYGEETELQKRIVLKGFNNYIIRTPKIIHLEGGSVGKANKRLTPFTVLQLKIGDLIFIKKHYSNIYFKLYVFLQLFTWLPFIHIDKRFNKIDRKMALNILFNFKKVI